MATPSGIAAELDLIDRRNRPHRMSSGMALTVQTNKNAAPWGTNFFFFFFFFLARDQRHFSPAARAVLDPGHRLPRRPAGAAQHQSAGFVGQHSVRWRRRSCPVVGGAPNPAVQKKKTFWGRWAHVVVGMIARLCLGTRKQGKGLHRKAIGTVGKPFSFPGVKPVNSRSKPPFFFSATCGCHG